MKYSRKIELAVCCLFTVICISGCGKGEITSSNSLGRNTSVKSVETAVEGKELPTAAEIVRSYIDHGYDNYRQSIEYSTEVELGKGDEAPVVPSIVTVKSDRAGNYIYEIQSISIEHSELELDYSDETYMVLDQNESVFYSSILGQDIWNVSSSDDPQEARLLTLAADDFENASCELDGGKYIVTVPLKDLKDSRDLYLSSLKSGLIDDSTTVLNELVRAIQSGDYQAVFSFSATDMKLLSIEYDPVQYSYKISKDSKDTVISFCGNMKITFSEYGKIKEKKVKVPESVIKNAKLIEDAS